MPKSTKSRKPKPLSQCRICRQYRVSASSTKIPVFSRNFRRLPGSHNALEFVSLHQFHADTRQSFKTRKETKQFSLTVKDICQVCEAKIASAVDLPAAAEMRSLTSDEPFTINESSARNISRWATKTCLLYRAADPILFDKLLILSLRRMTSNNPEPADKSLVMIGKIPDGENCDSHFIDYKVGGISTTIAVIAWQGCVLLTIVPKEPTAKQITRDMLPTDDFLSTSNLATIWPIQQPVEWEDLVPVSGQAIEDVVTKIRLAVSQPPDVITNALRAAGLL